MDDVVNLTTLTDSQKRLVKVIQAQAKRIIDEELREYQLSIRERLAAIQTRVETQLQTYMQRLDKAIAKEEAT